jgi:tetratricopeptide (TPR) repeat protein
LKFKFIHFTFKLLTIKFSKITQVCDVKSSALYAVKLKNAIFAPLKNYLMAKKIENADEKIVAVEEALSRSEMFIEKNQKIIIIALAAIVIVVLGFLGYRKFISEPREIKANNEIFSAQGYFEQDSLDKALNGDGQNAGFIDIINDYGSTKAGNLAKYYAGVSYLKKGEFQKAVEYLEDFSTEDPLVGPMAIGALGDAYLELGKNEKAVAQYMKASSASDNELTSPLFLMKAGMTYELLGTYDKALEVYKTIKTNYPRSFEGRDIDKYIARAEGFITK